MPHSADMDVPAVLQRLIDGGFTQGQLAERLSTTQQSVSRWMRGEREPSGMAMLLIREIAIEQGILVDVRTAPSAQSGTVPIMGYIGAGAVIDPEYEQVPQDGLEQVDLPYILPGDMIGFRIRGDSMAPAYENDAIIVVDREQPWATERMIGDSAAVRTRDGHRFLKRIAPGPKPQTFNLESIDGRTRTIIGARIVWASPVRIIIPNVGLGRPGRKVRATRR